MAGVHQLAANSHDEVGTFVIPDGRCKTVCCDELESRGGRHESQKIKAIYVHLIKNPIYSVQPLVIYHDSLIIDYLILVIFSF